MTAHAPPLQGHPDARRARIASTSAEGTEVLLPGDADRTMTVAARPDPQRASRILRTVDRAVWLRLEVTGTGVSGVLAGVRRRRPVRVNVDGSTALGLLDVGVPTVVRTIGTGS